MVSQTASGGGGGGGNNCFITSQTTSLCSNGPATTSITATANNLVWVRNVGSTIPTPVFTQATGGVQFVDHNVPYPYIPDNIELEVGHARTIKFPDDTLIDFKDNGSFTIKDKDAKVTYRANRSRDFNPFINASDKLEDFIRFCGDVGVKQKDMLEIPIKSFVQWLVLEAAKADGDDPSGFDDLSKRLIGSS